MGVVWVASLWRWPLVWHTLDEARRDDCDHEHRRWIAMRTDCGIAHWSRRDCESGGRERGSYLPRRLAEVITSTGAARPCATCERRSTPAAI